MDRTTLGRSIQPLERDGLIRIEPALSDRRAKVLHLTKAGEKRLQAGLDAWAKAQARFEAGFGSERAAELRTLVRAVVASQFQNTSSRRKAVNEAEYNGYEIKRGHIGVYTPF